LHQVQRLDCGAGRLLPADFPLLDRREARVQQAGEDRLTDMRCLADALDLGRLQGLDRREAQLVEFAQRDLTRHAGLVQTLGRVMHGRQASAPLPGQAPAGLYPLRGLTVSLLPGRASVGARLAANVLEGVSALNVL
jgi:hypothetical protein